MHFEEPCSQAVIFNVLFCILSVTPRENVRSTPKLSSSSWQLVSRSRGSVGWRGARSCSLFFSPPSVIPKV